MEKLKRLYLRYRRGYPLLDKEANGEYAEFLTCDVEGHCRVVSNEDITCVYVTIEEEKKAEAIEENPDTLARIEALQNTINTLWANASEANRRIKVLEEFVMGMQ